MLFLNLNYIKLAVFKQNSVQWQYQIIEKVIFRRSTINPSFTSSNVRSLYLILLFEKIFFN